MGRRGRLLACSFGRSGGVVRIRRGGVGLEQVGSGGAGSGLREVGEGNAGFGLKEVAEGCSGHARRVNVDWSAGLGLEGGVGGYAGRGLKEVAEHAAGPGLELAVAGWDLWRKIQALEQIQGHHSSRCHNIYLGNCG